MCCPLKVNVQGVKSLGGHFAYLCREFDFYAVKTILLFFKKKREIRLHFESFLKRKVIQKSKIAQIYYYDPQSAGINMQSTQSEPTPKRLTLGTPSFNLILLHISLDPYQKYDS